MKRLLIATFSLVAPAIATARHQPPGWDFFRQIIGPCDLYAIKDLALLNGAVELAKENLRDGFTLVSLTKLEPSPETPVASNQCAYTYVSSR